MPEGTLRLDNAACVSAMAARTIVFEVRGGHHDHQSPDEQALAKWRVSYDGLVSNLSEHFGPGSDWWFVPLSSRDHFASDLQQHFQRAATFEQALARQDGPVHVTCDDGLLATALIAMAQECGWKVRRPIRVRVIWAYRTATRTLRRFPRVFAHVMRLFRAWYVGCRHGAWKNDTTGLATVFVAPLHLPIASESGGRVRDTYFGDLPTSFSARGERVAIVGPSLCDPNQHLWATRGLPGVKIIALDTMITFADALVLTLGALRQWLLPPCVPALLHSPLPMIEKLVQREIDDAVVNRAHGAQLERAFRNLLKRSPSVRVIHTYENNWWERAINRPAAARQGAPATIGYLHCAVLESSLKNFRRRTETARPQPDRIVCTGPAAREALLSLGEYDPAAVLDGCALRAPDLKALPRREGALGQVRNILVLLEGLQTMAELIRLVADATPLLALCRIVVRAHPVLPLEKIAADAGVRLAPEGPLQPSSGMTLAEDIAAADVVIFKASSTALVAGYVGLPLIRYRDGWWLSDDPLQRCEALKMEVSKPGEIAAAIQRFESMSAEEIARERAQLRDYIERYLARPTAATLSSFST